MHSARQRALIFFACTILIAALSPFAHAQNEDSDETPPPLKTLSKTESKALEAEKDPKERTLLSLKLMESRLKNAEEWSKESAYRKVFFELGVFQGLIDNTLKYLYGVNRGTGRDFDNFKRLELALRSYTSRVETLRREAPERYERYLQSVLKQIRDARDKAIEPLFGDDVIRKKKDKNEQK